MKISAFILFFTSNVFMLSSAEFGVNWKSTCRNALCHGILWKNSDFVFLEPALVAVAVKPISKSGKICGFELFGADRKMFVASATNDGQAEIRLLSAFDVSRDRARNYSISAEAYDCDIIRHYSPRVKIQISMVMEVGVEFSKPEYSFSVVKNAKPRSVVGVVIGKGSNLAYKMYGEQIGPFGITSDGAVFVMATSLANLNETTLTLRVLATKAGVQITPARGIVTVTIHLRAACQPRWTGVPDQLDYDEGSSEDGDWTTLNRVVSSAQITVITCHEYNPVKVVLKAALQRLAGSPDAVTRCPDANSVSSQRVATVCGCTWDIWEMASSDRNVIEKASELPSVSLTGMMEEFTVMWWQYRLTPQSSKRTLFCLNDQESGTSLQLTMLGCTLIVITQQANSSTTTELVLPQNQCNFHNNWHHFSLSRFWDASVPILTLTLTSNHSQTMAVVSAPHMMSNSESALLRLQSVSVQFGLCSVNRQLSTAAAVGVRALSVHRSRALTPKVISCLTSCDQALLLADSNPDSLNLVEQGGIELTINSLSLNEALQKLERVSYINYDWISNPDQASSRLVADISLSLSINYASGSEVKLPTTTVRVVLPSSRTSGGIGDSRQISGSMGSDEDSVMGVDLVCANQCQVIAESPKAIRVLAGLRLAVQAPDNSGQRNNSDPQGMKDQVFIESCSVRPLDQRLIGNERIYLPENLLSDKMFKTIKETGGQVGSMLWSIEGRSSAQVFELVLRQLRMDTSLHRRQLSVTCILDKNEFSSQAIIQIIQSDKGHHYVLYSEDDGQDDNGIYGNRAEAVIGHHSLGERASHQEVRVVDTSLYSIAKSKFVAVIVMATMAGAAFALATAAVTYFFLRRHQANWRGSAFLNNRHRRSASGNPSINSSSKVSRSVSDNVMPMSLTHAVDVGEDDEDDADRISMSDLPGCSDDIISVDHLPCEHCCSAESLEAAMAVDSGAGVHEALQAALSRSVTVNWPPLGRRDQLMSRSLQIHRF